MESFFTISNLETLLFHIFTIKVSIISNLLRKCYL